MIWDRSTLESSVVELESGFDAGEAPSHHLTRFADRVAPLAVGLILFAAAVVLPLFRQTGSRSWQTIWAEDGFEYFEQARRQGGLAVLFRGYGGYLQLPPRMLAAVSTEFPIHDLPWYMALSATIVGALLAWFIYHFSKGWIGPRSVRLALASLIVLMPALGVENTANITNIIWIFAAVAPWTLVSLSEQPFDILVRSIVAFFAATASSLCFLFLPLAIGNMIVRRTRAVWIVTAVFLVGLLVQGVVVLHTKDIVPFIPKSFLNVQRTVPGITDATGANVFATFLIGSKGISSPWLNHYGLLTIWSTVIVGLFLVVLFLGVDRKRQLLSGVLVGYGVILFVVPAWGRQAAAPRYSVAPVFLLASAVAILATCPNRSTNRWLIRVGPPLFVAQSLVLIIVGFSVTSYRSESPNWSTAVTRAYGERCVNALPNTIVEVRTDLYNFWPVTLPCRDLSP